MKLKLIILILLVAFSGCRSKKEAAKSDISEKAETQITRTEKAETITSGTAVLDIKNDIKTDELMNYSGTYTKWSKPDSTGKQYPTETGTINGNNQKKTDDQTKSNLKTDDSKVDKLTTEEKINAIMGVKQKTNEKTNTETKAPKWTSWGVIALFVGLFFLVYLVLKRYGLIK